MEVANCRESFSETRFFTRLVNIQYSSYSVCDDFRKRFVYKIEQANGAIFGNMFWITIFDQEDCDGFIPVLWYLAQ